MPLKLLCDENLPYSLSHALTMRGFDVVRVSGGISDSDIAKRAQVEQRIIITLDSDFANILQYPPGDYDGIVRIKVEPPVADSVLVALDVLFVRFKKKKDFIGKLFILEKEKIRIWDDTQSNKT
jgi:hypothetical protein